MATGSGIQQSTAIVTTDVTPGYSVPHDNAIAQALGQVGESTQGIIDGLVEQHYAKVGAKDGAAIAAGTQAYHDIPVITDVGRARQAALQQSYLTNIKTDIDAHLDETLRANPLDPAGFKAAADALVTGYAKGAPGPFAVQVQAYAASRAGGQYQTLSDKRAEHDQVVAVNGTNARQQALTDTLLSLASSGQDGTPEYAAAQAEWTANNAAKVANPIFSYAPEQAAAAAESQGEQLTGAVLTHHATVAYNALGGEAGKASALALLKKEALDDGGALSEMTPARRLKLYGVAAANINALDRADAADRAMKAEAERQARADRRDYAGTLALGLVDGSVNEAAIHEAERDHKIEPGAAARLILSGRAQARTAAAMARVGENADRTANYGALSEMAANGQLTPAQLAANGANLTPLQRVAINGRINRVIAPGVANITGLADAAFRDGGIQGATAKLAQENLKADAAHFMQSNPGATVGQQTAFASDWIKKNKGLVTPGAMTPGASVVQTREQYSAAYRARFHGQTVSQSDVDKGWARYKAVHPTAR